ncbi:transposase [Deinococcus sp. QL22]|uniref:transposase n=1 Tax=Deinococcus sp. QL22 TaxID=2939437 RepID=UPI00353050FA
MSVPKQKSTAELKNEAVRLVRTTGKSCAQIARDLGVPSHYVVRWKQQQDHQTAAGRPAFTGRGIPPFHHRRLVLKNWNGSWKLYGRNGISEKSIRLLRQAALIFNFAGGGSAPDICWRAS